MYDIHHAKVSSNALNLVSLLQSQTPFGPMDAMILALRETHPDINFHDFDIITDAVNLQKLFAFAKNEGSMLRSTRQ